MAYSEILRLTLSHAYFGNDAPPLNVSPTEPREFDRAGCLLRQRGAVSVVLLDDDIEERPTDVALTLSARTHQVIEVTKDAVWGAAVHLEVPLQGDTIRLGDGIAPPAPENSRCFETSLAYLKVALPAAGRRDVAMSLEAIDALWAYHLTGADGFEGLEIVDSAGDVTFEDLGLRELPDGRPVRIIRSTQALAARARPPQRFALQKTGPFGPETLIAVLPAARSPFKPITEADAPMRLQSDIFVTLW